MKKIGALFATIRAEKTGREKIKKKKGAKERV